MILTDNLTPGMILSADVYARSGRLLLGAGTELTDKHIYVFRIWGVIEVDVAGCLNEDENHEAAKMFDPDSLDKAEAAVRPLFRHADLTHPGMQEIFQLSILRKVQHGIR